MERGTSDGFPCLDRDPRSHAARVRDLDLDPAGDDVTDEERREHGWARSWLTKHATVLTLLCMAALVLLPVGLAVRASSRASDAIDTIQSERTVRIYEQNAADEYICGRLEVLEELDAKVLAAALLSHKAEFEAGELSQLQIEARELSEKEIRGLERAGQCEVLIPPPPEPKDSK